jgi:hypothetical protein
MKTQEMKRTFTARTARGGRLVAEGKLYQLQGNARPHFSLTTAGGCQHKAILDAMRWLKPLVDVHLSDDTGAPMHALANALHFARQGDVVALGSHLRIGKGDATALMKRMHDYGDRRANLLGCKLDYIEMTRERGLVVLCRDDSTPDGVKGQFVLLSKSAVSQAGAEKRMRGIAESRDPCALSANAAIKLVFDDGQRFIIAQAVANLREQWQAEANAALKLLQPDDWRDRDLDEAPELALTVNGETIGVCDVHTGGYLPELDCDGEQYVVAATREEAGAAARRYWEDLAKHDPDEFAAIVGQETLVRWGMKQLAGPGTKQVSSLDEWFDLWLDTPEEEFASYDGEELRGTVNPALADELDWDSEADGPVPCVVYRRG